MVDITKQVKLARFDENGAVLKGEGIEVKLIGSEDMAGLEVGASYGLSIGLNSAADDEDADSASSATDATDGTDTDTDTAADSATSSTNDTGIAAAADDSAA